MFLKFLARLTFLFLINICGQAMAACAGYAPLPHTFESMSRAGIEKFMVKLNGRWQGKPKRVVFDGSEVPDPYTIERHIMYNPVTKGYKQENRYLHNPDNIRVFSGEIDDKGFLTLSLAGDKQPSTSIAWYAGGDILLSYNERTYPDGTKVCGVEKIQLLSESRRIASTNVYKNDKLAFIIWVEETKVNHED